VARDRPLIRAKAEFGGILVSRPETETSPSSGVEVTPVDARDGNEIERAVTTFARNSNAGLIVTLNGAAIGHRKLIITLAAQLARRLSRSLLCQGWRPRLLWS
jgi:hypothetical protein